MTNLYHCIYSSVASPDFNEDDLPKILKKARIANAAVDVTGTLAYINGNFLQIIEGIEAAIDALFAKAVRCYSHRSRSGSICRPVTATWTMRFSHSS